MGSCHWRHSSQNLPIDTQTFLFSKQVSICSCGDKRRGDYLHLCTKTGEQHLPHRVRTIPQTRAKGLQLVRAVRSDSLRRGQSSTMGTSTSAVATLAMRERYGPLVTWRCEELLDNDLSLITYHLIRCSKGCSSTAGRQRGRAAQSGTGMMTVLQPSPPPSSPPSSPP